MPDPPGPGTGYALVGLGSLAINQIMPAFAKCEVEARRVRQRTSGEGATSSPHGYGVAAKNIYNYENFDKIADNPDIDVGLHRAAQQHARRVHDPRAQGRQARAVREADGEHARPTARR